MPNAKFPKFFGFHSWLLGVIACRIRKKNRPSKIRVKELNFRFRNEEFSARTRKSRASAEAYITRYVAQGRPKIAAVIAEKDRF